MIDVKHQISEVRREVGSRVLEAGEARVVTLSQAYEGSLGDVWDACTNPERIARWFLPVSGDLRLGGRYQLEGNAGGTIERCDPPRSFAATWEFGGQKSWIEVSLSEQPDGRIRLELEHVAHVTAELWAQFGPGAVGVGWDMTLLGLARHLSGHEPNGPELAATCWSRTKPTSSSRSAASFGARRARRWHPFNRGLGGCRADRRRLHRRRAAARILTRTGHIPAEHVEAGGAPIVVFMRDVAGAQQ